ncbi:MAG: hypothetical protein AB8B57_17145 [Congregibacter sp.]
MRSLAGDAIYVFILFGAFRLLQRRSCAVNPRMA